MLHPNHEYHRDHRDRGHGRDRDHRDHDNRRFAHDDQDGRREHRHGGKHDRHRERLHGRDHEGGRGRLGRFFEHGDLRLVILALIAEKPRHGYEIIKAIEERVGGAYTPSPGVVYPTLTLLEEIGHVTVTASDGPRKLHTVTPEGEQHLAAHRAAVEALMARIEAAGQANTGADAPPVRRAMENLKLALRMRLSAGPLTPEQIRAVAASLDAAATAIDQI
jgi:DNA-binding PadR family transcriptional regulator